MKLFFRLTAAVLVVGLAAGACTDDRNGFRQPSAAESSSPAAPGSDAADVSTVRWQRCQTGNRDREGRELDRAGVQCAELTVPLDYRDPRGRTITIAISRLRAADHTERIGALLLNDGGPGGAGLRMPTRLRGAMKEVGDRYDLIGMDPRFVGRSSPFDCKFSMATATLSAGHSRRTFREGVKRSKAAARRCDRQAGDLLPFATTRNTARDMETVRIALEEEQISYLGYSYGSYLGSVYMEMFPDRTDRVVLDGPADPEQFGPRWLRSAGSVNEAALRSWARWVAARDHRYGLGRRVDEVMERVAEIYRVAARRGLQVGAHDLDDASVPWLLFNVMGNDGYAERRLQSDFVSTLSQATAGPVQPDPTTAGLIEFAFSRQMSSALSAQLAITCGDRATPRHARRYWEDIEANRESEPHFGGLLRNVTPCAFWPHRPVEPPTDVRNSAPALLVAAVGDPRTTYAQARSLHRRLTSSRLITLRGVRAHGIFGEYGNECVDRHVIDYLTTGSLPARNLTCRP